MRRSRRKNTDDNDALWLTLVTTARIALTDPEPDAATRLHIHRRDRLRGIPYEYRHVA